MAEPTAACPASVAPRCAGCPGPGRGPAAGGCPGPSVVADRPTGPSSETEDQQRREQRQDAVVRQGRRPVGQLVVLELPQAALQYCPHERRGRSVGVSGARCSTCGSGPNRSSGASARGSSRSSACSSTRSGGGSRRALRWWWPDVRFRVMRSRVSTMRCPHAPIGRCRRLSGSPTVGISGACDHRGALWGERREP